MAIEKKVIINVTEKGIDEINNDLKSLNNNLDKVEGNAKGAAKGFEDVAGNGGAIAILDALTGGLATKVRDAYEATKLFNFSLKGTRTALIATGIGALVVALGVVVAYWDDIVDFITGANKALEKQKDLINTNLERLEFELKLLEAKEKILIAEGKSTEEIIKLKNKILLQQQEQNALLLDNLKTQITKEKAQIREVGLWDKIKIGALQAAGAYDLAAQAIGEAVMGDEEEVALLAGLEKQLQDAELRSEALKLSLIELNKPTETPTTPTGEIQQRDTGDPILTDLKARGLAEIEATASIEDQKTAVIKRGADQRKIIAMQEAEFRKSVLAAEVDLAMQFGGLLRQLGEENKALAVAGIIVEQIASTAKIIMSTTEANAKAVAATPLTAGQPFVAINTISAALGIASGIAASAKAISQIGGGGGAGGAAGSLPRGQQAPPSFNVVGASPESQLAQTINQQQEPIQAFVVAGNVTTAQEANRNIVNTATLD